MTGTEFVYQAAKLSASGQNELINSIKDICTEKEINALLVGIAYMRQLENSELNEIMKAVLSDYLYKQFNFRG